MAIEKHQEIRDSVRDSRRIDERVTALLGKTPVAIAALVAMAICTAIYPWTFHFTLIAGALYWAAVAFDIDRQILPLYLPEEARSTDYHEPKEGNQPGFKKAGGIFFLGNEFRSQKEVWETASFAKSHKLIFGTTGAGKSELLTGLFVNYLMVGAGVIYSDAKGTKEMVSRLYNVARRFARDDDFFNMNYQTGGITVREGQRRRLTNTCNPAGFASADQLVQMFSAYLPKSSGDNQIFQEKAVALNAAMMPCLVDLRDLHHKPLNVSVIRDHITQMHKICDLAFDRDNLLTPKSRDGLLKYLGSLSNFSIEEFLHGGNESGAWPDYQINPEAGRMFGYASQYYMRALSSLADTYGHIYLTQGGEVDYADIIWNRRICVISLPALEKAPTELQSLAKINLSNIRGAISLGVGIVMEGHRSVVLDNLISSAKFPTGIILDEYGYQATEGFAIVMAQARGLGFSVTVAGQDLSNIEMGAKEEADAIFGNAALITLNIRNVKGLGDRIKDTVGEATVAISSGSEKVTAGPLSGYMDQLNLSVQQRHRVQPSDLIALETGQAFFYAGKGIGSFKYYPWAPIPDKSDWYQINRYLPMIDPEDVSDEVARASDLFERMVKNRVQGESRPHMRTQVPTSLRGIMDFAREGSGSVMKRYVEALAKEMHIPETDDPVVLTEASAPQPLTHMGGNTSVGRLPAGYGGGGGAGGGSTGGGVSPAQDRYAAGGGTEWREPPKAPVGVPMYDDAGDRGEDSIFGEDGDPVILEQNMRTIDSYTVDGAAPTGPIEPDPEDSIDTPPAAGRPARGYHRPGKSSGDIHRSLSLDVVAGAEYIPPKVAPTHEEAKSQSELALLNLYKTQFRNNEDSADGTERR